MTVSPTPASATACSSPTSAGATVATSVACVPVVAAGAGSVGVAAAQERTVGSAIDDVGIEAKITNKFLQSTNRDLAGKISSKSTEGVVVLTGKTQQQETAIEAVRLAVIRQQGENHLPAEKIPQLLDDELPQQAITSAFRKYKR